MYDLVVVGAGCAGCVAAERTAGRGFKVLLLDRQSPDGLGHTWVNGVERTVFGRLGIAMPSGEETMPSPLSSRLLGPAGKRYVETTSAPTIEVRMSVFVRRLLAGAVAAGAELRGETTVERALVEKDRVSGVVTASGEEIPARAVVDASGWEAVLRHGLPESSPVPREMDEGYMVTAWREQRRLPPDEAADVPRLLGIPPGVSVSRVGWRGGYSVLMLHWDPRESELDILVGFNREEAEESAGEFVARFLAEKGIGGERVYGGGGLIPVRRSLDVLVDHGLLLTGDSACMVIPAHGSGVASSLIAGDLAARTLARCLEEGDTGRENLWEYAAAYQRGRGALMAYFDVTRGLTDNFDREDMDKLVGYVMTPGDVEAGLKAEPLGIDLTDALRRLRSLRHPLFTARFAWLASAAIALKKIYEDYPERYDPASLEQWRSRVAKARRRLEPA
ncbi:MAG: NAD(P)/FAD-dependent oxidoreductase [Actinomycetota bacterium]|nr:NAD(P)/FAD-dependent oxidoreductase [Actinomycetota bacterium]MDD5666454.1 NAD(P)/FAD-dependent oxidoreductase [Actinomycetota bacterium]